MVGLGTFRPIIVTRPVPGAAGLIPGVARPLSFTPESVADCSGAAKRGVIKKRTFIALFVPSPTEEKPLVCHAPGFGIGFGAPGAPTPGANAGQVRS